MLTAQQKTYLALGDSYTIGESVTENKNFPNLLVQRLKGKFQEPTIIAKTGWRTDQLISAIGNEKLNSKFDLVSLLIGVNNQYQEKSIELFKSEFEQLVQMSIKLSKQGREGVVILSIPNYGVTPFAQDRKPEKITQEIRIYNAICLTIARKYGISFVDITPISEKARTNLKLLARDGLHPSSKMYEQWVEEILKELRD